VKRYDPPCPVEMWESGALGEFPSAEEGGELAVGVFHAFLGVISTATLSPLHAGVEGDRTRDAEVCSGTIAREKLFSQE